LHVTQNALQLRKQIVQRIVIAASRAVDFKMLELEIEEKVKKKSHQMCCLLSGNPYTWLRDEYKKAENNTKLKNHIAHEHSLVGRDHQ